MPNSTDESSIFDGVICFGGEDWWYHNRGHFDMQMMREFSGSVPVLYVNSIGMRVPRMREGSMFVTRIRRKLKSLRRGLVSVNDRFHVFSAFVVPGKAGMKLSGIVLRRGVRRQAKRLGIHKPLVWVACPPAASAVDALSPVAVVYQRTDRFESFVGVDAAQITAADRALKSRADITLFCSRSLHTDERTGCRRALYVDHGVDFEQFLAAGDGSGCEPTDLASISRPRVGFVGGIDVHTFDPALFEDVAKRLPDVQFVLVGGCSLPEDWCDLSNVHKLGQRPYAEVASYMAACDVLIMPWNQSEWIKACNPIKLKEYLAVGRPIVTTPFDELREYEGLVRVERSADQFAQAIQAAISENHDNAAQRIRVRCETWKAKANRVFEELADLGYAPAAE
jgi:glycosyltransferase involved in cell wall biosynthesis